MAILIQENGGIRRIPSLLSQLNCRHPLLVCGRSFARTEAYQALCDAVAPAVFSAFSPNPELSQVKEGVEAFRAQGCDGIVAIGGGSAIDVAKSIKAFCQSASEAPWLKEPVSDTAVPLVALPTTAGTGSEATHFAVVYENGIKYSVAHPSLRPQAVVLDADFLRTLPPYQKACSMMDALCQAIESHWSVRATRESIAHSRQAVRDIMAHGHNYVNTQCPQAAETILLAAHRAGCAIDITTTTAPHAMSYRMTKLYSLPHGHSVSLCLGPVWRQMLAQPLPCAHPSGVSGMQECFDAIAEDLGASSVEEALLLWEDLLRQYGLFSPVSPNRKEDLKDLSASVNPARLGNNPVCFDQDTLHRLYERIVK